MKEKKAIAAAEGGGAMTAERVRAAAETLEKYRAGKANLDRRIVENEQWYKVRHEHGTGRPGAVEPRSAWLFNAIANKHADAMDNYPSPVILPREEGDRAEAETLSKIVPAILDRCDFERVWSDVQMYRLKTGTGVYGVFWDGSLDRGLGDVSIRKIDLLNLFWEPGVADIEDSPNLFYVELCDNARLLAAYPQLEGRLGGGAGAAVTRYLYDDAVDTSDKTPVVDWYYKVRRGGDETLHFTKFACGVPLWSSEDDPATAERGFYDHGRYPFVFDTLYTVEGSPAGFGFIDVGRDAQEYVDRGGGAVLENLLAGARPRYFERIDGSINGAEFEDFTKSVVHVAGNLGEDSIRPVDHYPLSPVYLEVIREKIAELKETVGNRDVMSGGTVSGVTAASAIAAMQEAGAKLSRDAGRASYRAFRRVVLTVIELVRQFYDVGRIFRITGEDGEDAFISYLNEGIRPRDGLTEFGEPLGARVPQFDVKVSAEKSSPYSRMAQNELALELYRYGLFSPEHADAALVCLGMMDVDGKEEIMKKVRENGEAYKAGALPGGGTPPYAGGDAPSRTGESRVTAKARAAAAAKTEVR